MFVVKHQNSDSLSYYAINKGDIKDTEIDMIMDNIVDSLFSVFVTLGKKNKMRNISREKI